MTKHWLLIVLSAPIGAVIGAATGWMSIGWLLTSMGRGGHADLGIVWVAGLLGMIVGMTGLPFLLHRRMRRRR